jgi:uncharacterized protein (TIRG00374 family)
VTPDASGTGTDLIEPEPEQLSLGARLRDWRTIGSFVLAIAILAFVIALGIAHGLSPSKIWNNLRHANWWLVLAAFLVYYTTFPLRGFRWKLLLEGAYRDTPNSRISDMHLSGLTQIIFISWFVNCVVPAKLGDLYRAYLAKLWQNISWVKTVGTVVAERIVDLLVLAILLCGSGLIAFEGHLGRIKILLILGLILALAGIVVLAAFKNLGPQIMRIVPSRFRGRYLALEDGLVHSLPLKRLPVILAATIPIWLLEGLRIQLVFLALGVSLSNVAAVPYLPCLFFALGTAVLTTIPATPGGLGIAQAGMVGVMVALQVPKNSATDVVILDSLLSYWSIALVGFIVYLLSKRSHFRVATA